MIELSKKKEYNICLKSVNSYYHLLFTTKTKNKDSYCTMNILYLLKSRVKLTFTISISISKLRRSCISVATSISSMWSNVRVVIIASCMYVPVTYLIPAIFNFVLRSGAVQYCGILASLICALVSLTPTPLMLFLLNQSCMLIQQETKVELENNINQELESGEQEIVDLKDQASKIIDDFNDLTRAWSPMIAVTFATECVLLISAGFALSHWKPLNKDSNPHETYLFIRDYFMIFMLVYCALYILCVSWFAEQTHEGVKEFGSKVR